MRNDFRLISPATLAKAKRVPVSIRKFVSLLGKKLNIWKDPLPQTDEKLKGARKHD
ncbi:MAG: hypothetical protein ACJAVK_003498 [Akkermansiaceae bacterium]|jgi:hypothetical protein